MHKPTENSKVKSILNKNIIPKNVSYLNKLASYLCELVKVILHIVCFLWNNLHWSMLYVFVVLFYNNVKCTLTDKRSAHTSCDNT